MTRFFCLIAALSLSTTACGREPAPSEPLPAVPESEAARLAERLPGIEAGNVRSTPVPGLYEIQRGQAIGYITEDGRYLLDGDLVDLETGASLTEERRKGGRIARLEALGPAKMIEFAPPAANKKHTVTVFTDIDCGYCRKMHAEMADYNDQGIAIRYVMYPRSGPGTPSYRKAEAVWCSPNRQAAMTRAKLGADVQAEACPTPVMEHFSTGQELGLRGTPMLILPDGEVVQGYVPAAALASRLSESPKADPIAAR